MCKCLIYIGHGLPGEAFCFSPPYLSCAVDVWLWVSLAVGVWLWGAGPTGSDRASCANI